MGYKKYFKADKKEEKVISVNYKKDDLLDGKIDKKEDKTKSKPLFKDSGIVVLMEKAHLEIKDKKLKNALKTASGIGTAATRSSFIPILIKRGYIEKSKKKEYVPTEKGVNLYGILPDKLKNADFSAKLEFDLSQYIDGKGRDIQEIKDETEEFLHKVFNEVAGSLGMMRDKFQGRKNFGTCPKCGKGIVVEGKRAFGCSNWKNGCDFKIWREVASREMSGEEVKDLVENGRSEHLKGFKNKSGNNFDARLILGEDYNVEFYFGKKFAKETKKKVERESFGECPKCKKGNIIEGKKGFGCSEWKSGCDFVIWKEDGKVTRDNVRGILEES